MQRKRREYNTAERMFILHSIPILFKVSNKVKSNVLYSIPSVCVLVLLFGLLSLLNPSPSSSFLSTLSFLPFVSSSDSNNNGNNSNLAYAAEGTTQPEITTNSTSSLTLDTSNVTMDVGLGSTYYVNKDITIKAVNITDYKLMISSSTSLSPEDNTLTTFTGADSNTPTNMPYNSWGYSYGEVGIEQENKTYSSFTGTNQILEQGTISTSPTSGSTSDSSTNNYNMLSTTTKPLTLAAKFGLDTIPGTYHADITISLATTPAKVVFDNITTMQAMTPDICDKASLYDSVFLRDTRDNNYYTVTKLNDGRCWMTSNLALSAPAGGRVLTPEDSNVTTNYTLPANDLSRFDSDNTTQAVYIGADANNTPTGYYSWCAATAGSCSEATTSGANAPASICPKGWRLPTGYNSNTGVNEFYELFNSMDLGIILSTSGDTSWTDWEGSQKAIVQGSLYNFAFSGYVFRGSYEATSPSSNRDGRWWSSTAYDSAYAYLLYLSSSFVDLGVRYTYRYSGYAVRCIAEEVIPIGYWQLPNGSTLDSGIEYMQDIDKATTSGGFCSSSIPSGSTITLKDNRTYPTATVYTSNNDGGSKQQISNEYVIAKYPDGKCWMTQNLRLTGSDTATALITGGANGNSNTSGNYSIPKNDKSAFSSSDDTTQAAFLGSDNGTYDASHVTGYYSWCAATAGTCSSAINRGAHAPSSICPKGWHLPGGYSDETYGNEFYDLFSYMGLGITLKADGNYSSTNWTDWDGVQKAIVQGLLYNFAFAGRVSSGSYSPPASYSYGLWWSSTAVGGSTAYFLYVTSNAVSPGTNSDARRLGLAVRCITQ